MNPIKGEIKRKMAQSKLETEMKELAENAEAWYFHDLTTKKGVEHKADGALFVGEVLSIGNNIDGIGTFVRMRRPNGEQRSIKTGAVLDDAIESGIISIGKKLAIYYAGKGETAKGNEFDKFSVKTLSEEEFRKE
jgi:hypothetical protein